MLIVNFSTGTYDICEADGVARGTKIVMQLNKDSAKFAEKNEVESKNWFMLSQIVIFCLYY